MTSKTTEKAETVEPMPEPEVETKAVVARETALQDTLAHADFDSVKGMAEVFCRSGMFKDVRSASQAVVKIMTGAELGFPPIYSMNHIYMVEGKIGLAAETIGALLKRSKEIDYVVREHTDQKCTIDFFARGRTKPVYTSTFTIDDARRAFLVKPGSGWAKYPRALLFSRALTQGGRIVAPHLLGGVYSIEEVQSMVGDISIEGEAAESGNVGTPVPATQEELTPAEKAVVGDILDICPLCNEAFEFNRYGKRYHKKGKEFCNYSTSVKMKAAEICEAVGKTNRDFNEWTIAHHDGRTWSKLSEVEQARALAAFYYEVSGKTYEGNGRNGEETEPQEEPPTEGEVVDFPENMGQDS